MSNFPEKTEKGLDLSAGLRLNAKGVYPDKRESEENMASVTLITMKQAENLLQLSTWGLYQLLNSNVLPTVRIGGRRFIRLTTLRQYLTNLEKKTGGNYG